MHHRLIAILAILCFAFGGGGCAMFQSSNRDYDEVLMPLQTGSSIQRRVYVPRSEETKKKPKKKHPSSPKPETEPVETAPAQEEATPPPERFR
jgi:hypothetical protein